MLEHFFTQPLYSTAEMDQWRWFALTLPGLQIKVTHPTAGIHVLTHSENKYKLMKKSKHAQIILIVYSATCNKHLEDNIPTNSVPFEICVLGPDSAASSLGRPH